MVAHKVTRSLEWFNKYDRELAGEVNLDHIPFEELQRIVNPAVNDALMSCCYSIDEERAGQLRSYVPVDFDFERFDYCYACYTLENRRR